MVWAFNVVSLEGEDPFSNRVSMVLLVAVNLEDGKYGQIHQSGIGVWEWSLIVCIGIWGGTCCPTCLRGIEVLYLCSR